jgi:hypothetical protein
MSKMNLLVDLRVYDGDNANVSDTNSAKNISWQGFDIREKYVREVLVKSKSMKTLFSELNANFILNSDSSFQSQSLLATPSPNQESITIQTEEDRQSISISKKIIPKSLILSVGRILAFSGVDFDIEVTSSGTIITWKNSFATDGDQAIEIGDTVNLFYNYSDVLSAEELNSEIYLERYGENHSLLYLECSDTCKVIVNNIVEGNVNPVIVNGVKNPGYFIKSTQVDDIKIVNENDYDITVYIMLAK